MFRHQTRAIVIQRLRTQDTLWKARWFLQATSNLNWNGNAVSFNILFISWYFQILFTCSLLKHFNNQWVSFWQHDGETDLLTNEVMIQKIFYRWLRDDIVMWCDGCMMCGVWCVVYDDQGRGGEELPPAQTEDCGHWAWAHVCTLPHSAVTLLPCPVGASVLSASLLPWPRVSKCRCDGSLVGIFCNLINVIFLFDTCNLPWIRAVDEVPGEDPS